MQLPATCASGDLSRAAKGKRIGESRPVAGACGFAFQSSRECDENEVLCLLRENIVCSFAWAALFEDSTLFSIRRPDPKFTVNFSILNCSFVWAAVCGNLGCNFLRFRLCYQPTRSAKKYKMNRTSTIFGFIEYEGSRSEAGIF